LTFLHFNQWYANETFKTSALDDSCNSRPQEIRGFKCPVIYQTSIILVHYISVFFTPQQSPVIFQYKKQRKRRTNHAKNTIQLNLLRIVICGTNHNHYTYFSYRLVTKVAVTFASIRIQFFSAVITDNPSPKHSLSKLKTLFISHTQISQIIYITSDTHHSDPTISHF
jgi:hypothetical protein